MKIFYALIFTVLAGIQYSNAQNMVTVTNATGPVVCDGAAHFDQWSAYYPSAMWTWSWYQDSTEIFGADTLITGLCSGNYSLVLDSMGGSATYWFDFTVNNPCSSLVVSPSVTASESNVCTGTINISVAGGYPPYTYSWSNGSTTQNQTDLCPGNYMLTTADSYGCTVVYSINIYGDSAFSTTYPNLTITDDVDGNCLGTAAVAPMGGNGPYSVVWSNGEYGENIDSLCAGIYTVSIYGAMGDPSITNFVIADPNSTFGGNPYSDSIPVEELYGDLIENCTINYSTIDSASLANAIYDSVSQNLYVTWEIYSANGTVTYLYDTLGLSGQPGVYTVTVTVYCPSKSAEEYFKINGAIYLPENGTLSIQDQQLDLVTPYPNPFVGEIELSNPQSHLCSLVLLDTQGKMVASTISSDETIQMNQLEKLNAGVYFLKATTLSGSKTWKVIK